MPAFRAVFRPFLPATAFAIVLLSSGTARSETGTAPDATIPVRDSSSGCGRIRYEDRGGFFLALPAHLYGDLSAFGLHAGWQFPAAQLRLDLSVVERSGLDRDAYFAIPAVGIFASHDLAPPLRMYEGFSVGFQRGLHDAFAGTAWQLDYRAGLEVVPRADCSFFLEVGSGTGLVRRDGAFHGGTIVGGGVKYWVFP